MIISCIARGTVFYLSFQLWTQPSTGLWCSKESSWISFAASYRNEWQHLMNSRYRERIQKPEHLSGPRCTSEYMWNGNLNGEMGRATY